MAPAVHKAIFDGEGDAVAWLDEGTLLRRPQIGPLWIRLSAYPGGATIRRIDPLRVAVDVHGRKVTDTQGKLLEHVEAAGSPCSPRRGPWIQP
jgi:hypothetical protein